LIDEVGRILEQPTLEPGFTLAEVDADRHAVGGEHRHAPAARDGLNDEQVSVKSGGQLALDDVELEVELAPGRVHDGMGNVALLAHGASGGGKRARGDGWGRADHPRWGLTAACRNP